MIQSTVVWATAGNALRALVKTLTSRRSITGANRVLMKQNNMNGHIKFNMDIIFGSVLNALQ